MKTKIGTEVAHVTRDSDTTFRVKGQGHQADLLSAALTHQAGVAVTTRTYWGRGKLLLRCVCSAAHEALGRPWARRGAGHIVSVSPRTQLVGLWQPSERVSE